MIYEYACSECGHEWEVEKHLGDPPVLYCPKCEGLARRLISRTSFVLKGRGWAKDGYAPDGKA